MFFNLLLLLFLIFNTEANKPNYKILINNDVGTRSHVKGIFEVGDYLSGLGHKVVFASQKSHERYTKEYNISYHPLEGDVEIINSFKFISDGAKEIDIQWNFKETLRVLPKLLSKAYRLNYPQLNQLLKEKSYNLVMCDFVAHACQDAARTNGIPLIVYYQSLDNIVTLLASYKVNIREYGPLDIKNMSFKQRYYYKFIQPVKGAFYFVKVKNELSKVREEFQVKSNVYFGDLQYGLGLANSFFGFEIPVSVPPNIKVVGPLSKLPKSELDDELKEFTDQNQRIIFIAFGSIVKLGPKTIVSILEYMLFAIESKIIDGVIWSIGKSDITNLPKEIRIPNSDKVIETKPFFNNKHPNIRISNWLPQYSILNHENVKLFLTHGGIESLFEAIATSTPILCMPFSGDQPRNAKKIERMGIGQYLNADELNLENIMTKIKVLLEKDGEKIALNFRKYKVLIENSERKIQAAADIAIEHIKFSQICRKIEPYDSTKNSAPCEMEHLTPVYNELNYFVANGLDIYTFNLIFCILFVFMIFKLFSFVSTFLLKMVKKIISSPLKAKVE
ncbi:UDP-Glycosyltransferase/glycogen phosphorylase [Neoconidiobolus thromboides FSU 785]|nr:UDP-Glycosyltransferase/glycogen phosphorylase [Neoconidiobolus thromboides FSU 785]